MKDLLLIKLAAVLVAASIALPACGSAHGHDASVRSIAVSGQGEATGTPDQAKINAGVQTKAATVAASSKQNQAIVARIMAALKKEGIAAKNIQTTNYSVWPEQKYDPRGSGEATITGYRVNNTVAVTIDDIDKVGVVLGAVTDAGANTVHGINFGVKDSAALEQNARAAAMTNARERAMALAELAGVELGDVLTVSMTSGGGNPVPMMASSRMATAEAATVPGISAGELSVSVRVYVTFAIR